MMTHSATTYRTLIIGAGPAGTGPLVAALQQERLAALLDAPLAIIDRAEQMGSGTIGQYAINSDTIGATILESLRESTAAVFQRVIDAPVTQLIAQQRNGAVPLVAIGEYMALIGGSLQDLIATHPTSCFLARTSAHMVRRLADGTFETTLLQSAANGTAEHTLRSETVVFALGGSQRRDRALAADLAPGLNLQAYDAKVMLTNDVLTEAGIGLIEQRLQQIERPRVVIIGGSHSAFSSAWSLLNRAQAVTFGEGDITILHRDKLKLFYPSREAALAEGYSDFSDDDFCPVTQRLFRLGGFRLDSRELLLRIWGMRGADIERRVQLRKLRPTQDDPSALRALLDQADLIIPAFGYRPNTLPVIDIDGMPIDLLCNQDGTPPLVDTECRVLAADGTPIPGLYGIGLASGFKLSGKLGGEPSFAGQTNGLWLYQNGVGELILDQLLEPVSA